MTRAMQARADELVMGHAALSKMYHYLDVLRRSGDTNMYGAGAWLERRFDLTRGDARKVLKAWMDDFS